MRLQLIDWAIVVVSILVCFVPALFFGKRAGRNTAEFFASGRSVPWWLAGLSMVLMAFAGLGLVLAATRTPVAGWQRL